MKISSKSMHWETLRPPGHLHLSQDHFWDPLLDVSGSMLAPKDAQEAPQPHQHAEKETPREPNGLPKGSLGVPKCNKHMRKCLVTHETCNKHMRKLHVRPPWNAFWHPTENQEWTCNIPMRKSHILNQTVNKHMRKLHVRKCYIQPHLRKTSKTLQEITVSGGPKKPVLAREREARLNVRSLS